MEVILREDVPDLGIIGEVVNVKPGYARNYLIPRGMAVVADQRNLANLAHQQAVIEAKKLKERSSHEAMAEALGKQQLETEQRAGRGGKLFGSVTNLDVKKLLDEKGFDIDRRRILLSDPIKEIGDYEVDIRVGQDVTTTIKLLVRPLGGELEDEAVEEEKAPEAVKAAPVEDAAESRAETEDETSGAAEGDESSEGEAGEKES